MHGVTGEDPTEPFHSTEFPRPALAHEPTVQRFADSLTKQGLRPFRGAETMSDGAPSPTGLKSEAENRALRPALASDTVRLLTDAKVTKLLTNSDGTRVTAAEAVVGDKTVTIRANQFVLSAGAANSAAILLSSTSERHPDGLSNSSGVLGRNYMVHNSTFFMAVNPFRRNRTLWQKTLGLNDWYTAGPSNRFPLGNLQMLGKLQAPMVKGARPWVPMWLLKLITDRSLDIYLTTEDLPDPENRVRVEKGRIVVNWTPNNIAPHKALVRNVSRAARKAGYPVILTQRMGIATNSHMCGTVVAGNDPATSILNPDCRSHDVDNLWVVDGSFFPSSGALNPALTIAANALRVVDRRSTVIATVSPWYPTPLFGYLM